MSNHKNSSQWAQIIGDIVDKLVGTNISTTIKFDGLEIDVPQVRVQIARILQAGNLYAN